jgi:ribonuclease HI
MTFVRRCGIIRPLHTLTPLQKKRHDNSEEDMADAHVYIFADGSASGSGIGAWASLVVVPATGKRKLLYGVAGHTTINRCELQPLIDGLRWVNHKLSRQLRVRIVSDSQQTVRTIGGEWEPKGNLDLWAAFHEEAATLDVRAIWRERNTHPYMGLVDAVAYSLRKSVKPMADKLEETVINEEDVSHL